MFYVYILKSKKDKDLYIGFTNNLVKRFKLHNTGMVNSTKNRAPFELIYYEAYKSDNDARRREIQLKRIGSQREIMKKRISESLIL